jgi:hypothetical protein
MNIYRKLSTLLKDASTFEFEDKVVQTVNRIAQNQGDVRVNSEIMGMISSLQQENTLLKQQYTKLFLENQQLKGTMLDSATVPSGVQVSESPNMAGGLNVEVDSTSQPVLVKNVNFQESGKATLNEFGYTQNSNTN